MESYKKLLMVGILGLAFSGAVFGANTMKEESVNLATLESLPKDLKGYLIPFIISEPDFATAAKDAAAIVGINKEHREYRIQVIEVLKKRFKTKQEAQEELFKLSKNGKLNPFTLEVLQKAGADLDMQDEYKYCDYTALIWAAKEGYKEIVDLLIKAKADLNMQDEYGNTALMWAAQCGYKEIVSMLIKAGADPNKQFYYGDQTALMVAALYEYKEIVEMLIEAKADLNMQNKYGETALDIAKKNGHKEVVQMLEQAMSGQSNQEQNKEDKNRN